MPLLSIVPAERQHRAVAHRHGAGVVDDRRLIEHEVARGERRRIDAVQRNRLAGAERDHRVAVAVPGNMVRKVAEAGNAGKARQVDFVGRDVEIVDRVVADRLREDEEVVAAGAGQRVVARPGEDRQPRRIGLDVVGHKGGSGAAVRRWPRSRSRRAAWLRYRRRRSKPSAR